MYSVIIRSNGGAIVNKFANSSPELAIEQFKLLVSERLVRHELYLVEGTTQLWRYDLDPATEQGFRWRAKSEPITHVSIMPRWESVAIITVELGVTRQLLRNWATRLVDGYNVYKRGRYYYYDRYAIDQLMNKAKQII